MPKIKAGDVLIDKETGEIEEVTQDALDSADAYLRSYGLRPLRLDDRGHEVVDPVPVAPPIGYKPQPSMVDIVRAQIQSQRLAEEAEAAGMETFEEADDFDVDDDFDPSSPYEEMFDPAPPPPRFETSEETLGLRRDRPPRPQRPAEPAPAPSPSSPQSQVEPASASPPARSAGAEPPASGGPPNASPKP